jgi:thiol reductant ABC exporter CydC subunit
VSSPTMRMWKAMHAQRGRLTLAAFLGLLASASSVALLGTSGWLISYAAEMPPVLALGIAAVLVRTFALTRSVFRYAERLVGHDAAFRGLTSLRVHVYERLEVLAPVGLAKFRRGDLLARLVADIDTALDLPLRVVLPWVQGFLVSLGTVAFLLWLNPAAGVSTAIALAIGLLIVPWIVARMAAQAEARLAPARGVMSASVVASVEGSADLLAYGATGTALGTIRESDAQLTQIARRESAGLGFGAGLGILVQGVAVAAALALAMPAVTDGRLAPVWLAVVALVPLAAYELLSTLPASALALQRVRSSAARVVEILDAPNPVPDPVDPVGPPVPPFAIHARDVSARWSADAPPALRSVDLRVEPGQRVGIVGPSGSGKSTLAAVLLGFLPYQGSVRVGGREIADLRGDDLRADVTLLTQRAHIFDTTVEANLRLGKGDASDEQLMDALTRVHLDTWCTALPMGVETEVGPQGITMSGGERQRLALARLLLAQRAVMVLDEPTEHLDPQTADALTDVCVQVSEQVTVDGVSTILITHRLRGLENFDHIIVLIEGEVAASGTHAELIRGQGWYAQRWAAEQEQSDLASLIDRLPVGQQVRGEPGSW